LYLIGNSYPLFFLQTTTLRQSLVVILHNSHEISLGPKVDMDDADRLVLECGTLGNALLQHSHSSKLLRAILKWETREVVDSEELFGTAYSASVSTAALAVIRGNCVNVGELEWSLECMFKPIMQAVGTRLVLRTLRTTGMEDEHALSDRKHWR
jgi:DNA-binding IclR family transcriptional regulator